MPLMVALPQPPNAVKRAVSAGIGAGLEELAIESELRVDVVTDAGRAYGAGA